MVMADTPSMEVESHAASSTCSDTCSKVYVRHGNGGGSFQSQISDLRSQSSPRSSRAFLLLDQTKNHQP